MSKFLVSDILLLLVVYQGMKLKFIVEIVGEVSVLCIFRFSYEDNIMFTVSLHKLHTEVLIVTTPKN